MIELNAVTRRYGRRARRAALDDVSLSVPAGAVWAVVGPNGAGKSTLLSLILGFIRPTRGTVTIAGDRPRDYLRDFGASYLPERFALPSGWRVRDALELMARLDRVDDAARARAIAVLGLDEHLDKRVGELSRGLLQRLGLAQAMLGARDLVVLDEPTEGLDPVWRVRLRDVMAALRAEQRTVLVASHDLAEVERIADRVVVLEGGRVRDILDVHPPDASIDYHIRLARPFDSFTDSFPDAVAVDATSFTARVSGAPELTQRLGALIASGAVVAAVEPVHAALEDRVRGALEGDDA